MYELTYINIKLCSHIYLFSTNYSDMILVCVVTYILFLSCILLYFYLCIPT